MMTLAVCMRWARRLMRLVTTNSPMVTIGSTANHFSVLHWGGSDLGYLGCGGLD